MQHSVNTPWQDADTRPQDRRGATRHAHFEHVALQTDWADVTGALLDLSSTGGQLRIANGMVPFEGDEVTLRLVDAQYVCGHVAWVGKDAIGIAFDRPVADIDDLRCVEQRGREWYRRAAHPQA